MDAVTTRFIDAGEGTAEAHWLAWLARTPLAPVTAERLVPPGRRAVVVAPHPDDEVLAVGGLLAQLGAAGCAVRVVAVTDGTASHRGSAQWPPDRLAQERPRETQCALARLGVDAEVLRLGLPDGGLALLREPLAVRLAALLSPADVVFTTWRRDGHPDHEATGHACAFAAARTGAALYEVPVWGWHWAAPGDPRVPWHRVRVLALDPAALRRKRAAVQAFTSQLLPDPSTGHGPVLRDSTLARAARPFELLLT